MRLHWARLSESDREVLRVVTAFLEGRMEERATIDWTLQLRPKDDIQRLALLHTLERADAGEIREPWFTAWRLIEESWEKDDETADDTVYALQRRIQAGERTGSLVKGIVDLVLPRLQLEPRRGGPRGSSSARARPKAPGDLFSARLTSGRIVDPDLLGIESLTEGPFLSSLATRLEFAVQRGLDIGRRIGWSGDGSLWRLGQLHRAYYVRPSERSEEEEEPDEFHRGIAPPVKLLHAVVSRLVDVDLAAAIDFAHRWKRTDSPVHTRLWAALARVPGVTPSDEVAGWLLALDHDRFWSLSEYPEIAELRAVRFSEFTHHKRSKLAARIRRQPPRGLWPRGMEAERLAKGRLYWAVRELRRIEIGSAGLPDRHRAWLDEQIVGFPDLRAMARVDEGFPSMTKARWVPPNPDNQYDALSGEARLIALETALSSRRGGWDDDPAERARDWMRQRGRQTQVLGDLESLPEGGGVYPLVWEQFGWAHSPAEKEEPGTRDLPEECRRVVALLRKLPDGTVEKAIHGISQWISAWEKQVVTFSQGVSVWLRLWPIAVRVTNADQPAEDIEDFDVSVGSLVKEAQADLDTLNNPAGKFVGVFLAACPPVSGDSRPFANRRKAPRRMRDAIVRVEGRSMVIALYRMIEGLPYFLQADPEWTREHLIGPLLSDESYTIALWRAIARRTQPRKVVEILGEAMADRVVDQRLDRDTRQAFAFNIIVDCLYSLRDGHACAVPKARVQQMVRSVEDEVRAFAAGAVTRFVQELSATKGEHAPASPEELFSSAAAPFLKEFWPQERSLTTPGVSGALAHLPAAAREAFAVAVSTIEPFLVPFECWAMHDYGLHGKEDGEPRIALIDDAPKAAALLRLLELTVGAAEGSVVPYDLADALDQIRSIAPALAETPPFRRLATAARRS